MAWIRGRVVVVRMTSGAGIWCVVIIAIVANRTVVCNRDMGARYDEVLVVIEGTWCPTAFAVAGRAIRWEVGSSVIWIGRTVVVIQVASDTGIWRIVVIAVVAGRTIIGDGSVSAIQLIVVVVNIESRGLPSGLGGVAAFAVRWQAKISMVWVGCCVVVVRMTSGAGVRRIGIIAVVTSVTVVCNRDMSARHDEVLVVIEGTWCPTAFTVAGGAIRWEVGGSVVWIGGTVVVIQVASDTGVRRIVVITVVAGRTVVGDGSVSAIQLIVVVVNIESCGLPSWLGGVAAFAVRW